MLNVEYNYVLYNLPLLEVKKMDSVDLEVMVKEVVDEDIDCVITMSYSLTAGLLVQVIFCNESPSQAYSVQLCDGILLKHCVNISVSLGRDTS